MEDGPLFVQPMIVGRTREVTRAVVELKIPIKRQDISVSIPDTIPPPGRHKITEEDFFEHLASHSEEAVIIFARDALAKAKKEELEIAWLDAGPSLRYREEVSGTFFTLGQLNRNGLFSSTGRLCERVQKESLSPEIYQSYFDEIASLIPGAARKSFKPA